MREESERRGTEAPIHVCAFYKFVRLEDCEVLQGSLKDFCQQHQLKGTILLAREGFNGTVAGAPDSISALKERFEADPRLRGSEMKDSWADGMPFERMKVRWKAEIVSLGEPDVDPAGRGGTYVEPSDWNQILKSPIPVIDTRNHYECVLGSFPGAVDPNTRTFKEFKDYVATLDPEETPEVAMFCTGGIRCEKASAYMLRSGFRRVFQLHGGILRYLEDVPAEESLWEGECFVFDNRIALKQGLELGDSSYCLRCQSSLRPEDITKDAHWEYGVSCRYCFTEADEKT